ncbi:MAG: hypothetical protein IJQ59_03160 [Bacteroidaceae bacterium]|nr:hypothetical protein [Bacteroidaceae bacterium]
MRRYIFMLCVVLASAVLYTSCMGDDSRTNTTVYEETAITAFRLTTVNRYLHTTTKSGKDSVYKKTLSNPAVFTIDQNTYEIYNTDSLPYGCDVKHVLATITSKNSSQIMIKSMVGDTLRTYYSTDSIDFSNPREIQAYNSDLSNHRSYTVKVNVRQYDNSSMIWELMSIEDMPIPTSQFIDVAWQEKVKAAGLREFIGEGTIEAYAYDNDGKLMVSVDGGLTWKPDSIGGDASLLPTSDVEFLSLPFAVNDSTDYQLLVGSNENDANHAVVWRKVAEFGYDSDPCKWVQIPFSHYNTYALPKLKNIDLLHYNGLVLAIGSDKKIYQSRDKGITWKTSSAYQLPKDLQSNDFYAFVDEDYIWIVGNDNGEVWRGLKIE